MNVLYAIIIIACIATAVLIISACMRSSQLSQQEEHNDKI